MNTIAATPNQNGNNTFAELTKTLDDWIKRCADARGGHYARAEKLFYRSQVLGYILICATVFVTVFSFYEPTKNETLLWGITKQHIIVFMGCISAVISGIVTQARHGERAEIHRAAGAQYANLAREFEVLKLKYSTQPIDYADAAKQSAKVIAEWKSLAEDAPLTPHKETHYTLLWICAAPVICIALFFVVARSSDANPTQGPSSASTQHQVDSTGKSPEQAAL